MSDWLQNLKAGDEVIVPGTLNFRSILTRRLVDRATPTQIIIGESRYLRRTGTKLGSSGYDRQWLHEPTELKLQIVKRDALCTRFDVAIQRFTNKAKADLAEFETPQALVDVLNAIDDYVA